MRKLYLIILILFTGTSLFSQSVSGRLVDSADGLPLMYANVVVDGISTGATTDSNGAFTIDNVPSGNQNLVVTYVGYESLSIPVNVGSGDTDLGAVRVGASAIGLNEVQVVANVAIDRKTPVAVSTLKSDVIEAKLGNNEFPEILNKTPSIYSTKGGGGFGDARINVRGFNQRNVAVLINGIPVNDMENGWVYWSNWAGLSDVTRSMQVQRGLGGPNGRWLGPYFSRNQNCRQRLHRCELH